MEFPQSVDESEYIRLVRSFVEDPGSDDVEVRERAADLDALLRSVREQFAGTMSQYEYGLREVMTKVEILRDEYRRADGHGPIEHVNSRIKSPDSIFRKMVRRGYPATIDSVRENVRDIAGIRITTPYVTDTYLVARALSRQPDLTVLATKDYVAEPKPNGYRSLHLIVTVPVFLSDRTIDVPVEIQIRTIAMDFWASVEHQLRYKFDGVVPEEHSRLLEEVARTTRDLDAQVGTLREKMLGE